MTGLAGLAAVMGALAAWLAAPVRTPSRARTLSSRWVLAGVLAASCLALPRGLLPLGLVGAAVATAAHQLWRRRVAARAGEATAGRMAEVCDLIASELAAGRPTDHALDEAAAAWPAMRRVADVSRLGGDVPAAFREVAQTPGAGALRLLAAAWTVSQRTGGGLAAATRRVADAVRRDQATQRLVAGELASARATARLVACLPLVALLMGSGAGADPWSFLLRTPWGLASLSLGLAIGYIGLWWIELIAREVDR